MRACAPVFVTQNWVAGSVPPSILVNGVPRQADVDYYPSLDLDAHRLWLTLRGGISGMTRLQMGPS